ncbi:hypothetical protein [Ktedonobacter robiniae]|uniref:Uncharacterized protein n=1 Tax=Ktedonobacter robiniae TaxID=2778365 RepID=A0ABQ3V1H6_9CHLR|nr:hypothetical protein [Ktedonobacter robiniae]GHO58994.1 hypothetical protein KSB_74690 [Ktedonobacter robiniae]
MKKEREQRVPIEVQKLAEEMLHMFKISKEKGITTEMLGQKCRTNRQWVSNLRSIFRNIDNGILEPLPGWPAIVTVVVAMVPDDELAYGTHLKWILTELSAMYDAAEEAHPHKYGTITATREAIKKSSKKALDPASNAVLVNEVQALDANVRRRELSKQAQAAARHDAQEKKR